jgi:hypothetical protein
VSIICAFTTCLRAAVFLSNFFFVCFLWVLVIALQISIPRIKRTCISSSSYSSSCSAQHCSEEGPVKHTHTHTHTLRDGLRRRRLFLFSTSLLSTFHGFTLLCLTSLHQFTKFTFACKFSEQIVHKWHIVVSSAYIL